MQVQQSSYNKKMKTKTMTTLHSRKSIDRLPLRLGLPRVQPIWIIRGFLLIPLVLAWFALSPTSQAVSPAPDGGYAGSNTAEGQNALSSLTTGSDNTALGFQALFSNTTGDTNTASGSVALFKNTTGSRNTGAGFSALSSNTTGSQNTATGYQALFSNTIGTSNTAMGFQALFSNTTGNQNAAVGEDALSGNTTGHDNIALGYGCGGNITTGSNNIDIGNKGADGEGNTIRIGTSQSATFIAGIRGAGVMGTAVHVNAAGQLGTAPSSQRFKDQIEPMDKASEAILALKPVTFRYKKELDPDGIPQFGLVAEQVEKVNPDLVTRDAQGKPYTVRYEAVNAMLLNEFLKEHRTVQGQQSEIDALKAELKEQKALIQKVSAQIEVTKPTPRVVNNNQ